MISQSKFAPQELDRNAASGAIMSASGESLELMSNADGSEAVLYVYRNGKHWTTATGRLNKLREFAARYYPGAQLNERIVE